MESLQLPEEDLHDKVIGGVLVKRLHTQPMATSLGSPVRFNGGAVGSVYLL